MLSRRPLGRPAGESGLRLSWSMSKSPRRLLEHSQPQLHPVLSCASLYSSVVVLSRRCLIGLPPHALPHALLRLVSTTVVAFASTVGWVGCDMFLLEVSYNADGRPWPRERLVLGPSSRACTGRCYRADLLDVLPASPAYVYLGRCRNHRDDYLSTVNLSCTRYFPVRRYIPRWWCCVVVV